jgi:tRNA (guanine-N7-)-methyltransferase
MNRRPGSKSPHFHDYPAEKHVRTEVNPYIEEHSQYPEVIPAAKAPFYKGRWHEAFGREAPLHLELGAGNGFHLSGMAALHPEYSWLGLELRFKRVVLCVKKLQAAGLSNARITRYNWFYLNDLFEDSSLDALYLHHPDPWPKADQAQNRIIDRAFCELMSRLLKPGASWRTKTDFAPHIQAILTHTNALPFQILGQSADLQQTGSLWQDDVITNYQRKSYEKGIPVHAIWLQRL